MAIASLDAKDLDALCAQFPSSTRDVLEPLQQAFLLFDKVELACLSLRHTTVSQDHSGHIDVGELQYMVAAQAEAGNEQASPKVLPSPRRPPTIPPNHSHLPRDRLRALP